MWLSEGGVNSRNWGLGGVKLGAVFGIEGGLRYVVRGVACE